jgi:hypothetical protein
VFGLPGLAGIVCRTRRFRSGTQAWTSEFRFQLLLESMVVSYDPIQKARRYQIFAQDLIERARADPNGAGLRLIAERYLVLAERELKRPLFTVLDGEAAERDRAAPAPQSRPQLNIVGDLGWSTRLRTGS